MELLSRHTTEKKAIRWLDRLLVGAGHNRSLYRINQDWGTERFPWAVVFDGFPEDKRAGE